MTFSRSQIVQKEKKEVPKRRVRKENFHLLKPAKQFEGRPRTVNIKATHKEKTTINDVPQTKDTGDKMVFPNDIKMIVGIRH